MITVSRLHKRFGERVAVDDLTFTITPGETFGLLGPNGAGKTTTINMLVGLLKPDQGSIQIGAELESTRDPRDSTVRQQIGIAPQSLSLYDELTARENLDFFGGLYGLAGSILKKRREWVLELSGLTDRQRDRVGTYSGGMKRRLNIAAALIHEPSILLLDEPTVGVDPQSRNHIFESIQALSDAGLTIVYTTHYMEEAQRLCDRVAIMDHGKLLALDTVDRLVESHGSQAVVTAQIKNANGQDLPGTLNDDRLRFESDAPLEDIAQLNGLGVEFQTLNIERPDLESVFLSLTGRSLRD